RDRFKAQLDAFKREQYVSANAALQIPATEKALDATEKSLAEKLRDREQLTLKAGTAGAVLPAPPQPKREDPNGALPTWTGTPFDLKNANAFMPPNVLFCQIGDPTKM